MVGRMPLCKTLRGGRSREFLWCTGSVKKNTVRDNMFAADKWGQIERKTRRIDIIRLYGQRFCDSEQCGCVKNPHEKNSDQGKNPQCLLSLLAAVFGQKSLWFRATAAFSLLIR